MRILNILIFFLSATAFAQNTPLTVTEITRFQDNVALIAKDIKSVSGDFTQTKYIQLMQDEAVSTGRMYYKFPNLLKWEYYTPYNFIIVLKDNQLLINDEGNKSVTSLNSNKIFEKLVNLISGSMNGKLLAEEDNFEIKYFRNGPAVTAVLVPKDASLQQFFSEIILIFNKEHLVNSIKLIEESGDFTLIDLNNIKINSALDNSVFQN